MIRANVATAVEQGPPGILRVGVGPAFHSNTSREFYFGKLASAYHTWVPEGYSLVTELWEGGRKIGEYTDGTFSIGPAYSTPLDCPQNATSGLCSSIARIGHETCDEGS